MFFDEEILPAKTSGMRDRKPVHGKVLFYLICVIIQAYIYHMTSQNGIAVQLKILLFISLIGFWSFCLPNWSCMLWPFVPHSL